MSYKRKIEDKKRLRKLSKKTCRRYILSGACRHWKDERIVRLYRPQASKKWKQICNKRIRHKELHDYSYYKKASAWEINLW